MPEPLPVGSESLRIRAVRRRRHQDRAAIALLLILAVAVFSGGITWGLPSREADGILFGSRPAWSGGQIVELTGRREAGANLGADVDRDPLLDRDQKVIVNQTDRQRAEIVRRYRLFSYQPDEMVTMMALREMSPGQGDFDPKLYQYGGLWIYPVGVVLKVCSLVGLVQLTPDVAYYLDHPDQFGRFYVVARLYVVAWAVVGAWAVFALTRRLAGGSVLAACVATFCYVMMPVVVNMSHEAKPHLPGAVLMLLALLAAVRYVRTADWLWWVATAALSGLAVGMVLAAWPIIVTLPLATLLIRQEWLSRLKACAWGLAVVVAAYFATNPYVLINLFNNRELLQSNLSNTRAMFNFGFSYEALTNAARLIAEGASPSMALAGFGTMFALAIAAVWGRIWARRYVGWLVVAPSLLALAQFVLFAGGQPAEYGRFAVFVDIVLVIGAVVGVYFLIQWLEWRPELLAILGLAAAIPGSRYYAGFVDDTFRPTSRTIAAQLVEIKRVAGNGEVGIFVEPAPYAVPPLNLFDGPIVLLPKGYDALEDDQPLELMVRTADRLDRPPEQWLGYEWEYVNPVDGTAAMSWAAKPFLVISSRTGP